MIVGDANLSEVATFLKVGTTALVLSMIEDDWLTRDLLPAKPVQALRHVSYDITLARPIELADGSSITALEAQWELYDRARKFAEEHGSTASAATTSATRCSAGGSRCSPASRPTHRRCRARSTGSPSTGSSTATGSGTTSAGTTPGSPPWTCSTTTCARRSRSQPESGSSGSPRDDEMARADAEPPPDTRAFFRGRCLQRWPESIVAANWDSLVFDVGGDPLRRVPMMEPLRGTEAHVGSLIDGCETAADLLEKLGQ